MRSTCCTTLSAGLQLSTLIKRLGRLSSCPLQWAALSATIGRLSDVRDFLFGAATECTFLEGQSKRAIDAVVKPVASIQAFNSVVDKMLGDGSAKLLVFANSRRQCEELASSLQTHNRLGSSVFAHYSSLSPEVRVETERAICGVQDGRLLSDQHLGARNRHRRYRCRAALGRTTGN